MTRLPGISGSLLPGRYLAEGLDGICQAPGAASVGTAQVRLQRWWRRVSTECGPATGLRALFDLVAMPLFAALGFRARAALFHRDAVHVGLETARGAPVSLVLLPWARRPAARWRDLVGTAREAGADWAFLLAPPFVSLVDARARATRRSLDYELPDALDSRSFDRFWLLSRAEAFDAGADGLRPSIERIVARGALFQDRVREDLQRGVVEALAALDPALRPRRGGPQFGPPGERVPVAPFDEALTLVYRTLFLLFAESRDLVPRTHPVYGRAYSVAELCRAASAGTGNGAGLWDGLAAITRLARTGCRTDDLIVRPFNGRLFARAAAPSLESVRRARGRPTSETARRDGALGRALVALGTRPGRGGREEISYADLGVEQLGAVYERVLDLNPGEPPPGLPPGGRGRHSIRRKQTGTFYTPQPLAEFVVRRTLAPLVGGASSDAILGLRVVDPAMGSGAFLVAACRYLASAYERALVEEGRCAETDLDEQAHAGHRRLVAERCLAGVDLNPTAVQLARLSMWLTTLSRGKPLTFLDHRLRVGNSLLGAAPEDLWRLSPARRPSQSRPLLDALDLEHAMRQTAQPLMELARRRDDTVADVRQKEALWARVAGDRSPLGPWRQACSLWCARFFWPDDAGVSPARPSSSELRATIDAILGHDRTIPDSQLRAWTALGGDLAARHAFFHWPLEFADVFHDEHGVPRADGGFDAVIGNPPWEMLRRDAPDLRRAGPAATRESGRRVIDFIRGSGLYRSCGRGHLNLYQPFLERALAIVRPRGRVGLILPWGLAADDGAAELRRRLLDRGGLETILGLDNSAALFPIHRGLRFVVITASPETRPAHVAARFGVRTADEIDDLPDVDEPGSPGGFAVRLDRNLIAAIGGPALRIPDVRRHSDLDWLQRLTRDLPPLGAAAGWHARFGRELNATEDRGSFGASGLPVIEGKHIAPFVVDARAAPWRIAPDAARRHLPDRRFERARLGYRDVSGVGNRLSLIAAMVPAGVVTTHTIFCLRSAAPLEQQQFLCALFNSYVLNAVVRMLMGAHVTTSLVEGLPAPRWTGSREQRRIAKLASRLAARPSEMGLNAALQASVARLYGFDVRTFESILDTFPLVPKSERDAAARVLEAEAAGHGGHGVHGEHPGAT